MSTAVKHHWPDRLDSDADELDRELMMALETSSEADTDQGSDADDHAAPACKRQRREDFTSAATHISMPSMPSMPSSAADQEPTSPGAFEAVPDEVLLRVLSFLPADDLTSCAQSCRYFQRTAADDILWRRLFYARWGRLPGKRSLVNRWGRPPGEGGKSSDAPHSWKAYYMEKDGIEMSEVEQKVPAFLREYYLQMTAAKRSKCLGRAHSDDMMFGTSRVADAIASWRRQHGFDVSKAPAAHGCPGRCSFRQLGPSAFVCERTGWAHVCDDACRERIVDEATDMLVCPISGRCFERMMTEWEEEAHTRTKGEDRADEGAEDCSMSGRLGEAYVAGYNCTNEAELQRVCGVRF
ncbi:hypothetical protein WJX72_008184 [[Myrmecia] bisecta]|uniref:F-box domain-containing protein n=1 Tax=[Myrmecia] bisecta TaxID=41462 RepID=A0AAW1P5C6_9CHLO